MCFRLAAGCRRRESIPALRVPPLFLFPSPSSTLCFSLCLSLVRGRSLSRTELSPLLSYSPSFSVSRRSSLFALAYLLSYASLLSVLLRLLLYLSAFFSHSRSLTLLSLYFSSPLSSIPPFPVHFQLTIPRYLHCSRNPLSLSFSTWHTAVLSPLLHHPRSSPTSAISHLVLSVPFSQCQADEDHRKGEGANWRQASGESDERGTCTGTPSE